MKNPGSTLMLGALGLIAASDSLIPTQASPLTDQKVEALNKASLKTMESSWLAIPPICKARGFNADAVEQTKKQTRDSIQAIYASYEV